jgi:phosphopantetheinyl transferase
MHIIFENRTKDYQLVLAEINESSDTVFGHIKNDLTPSELNYLNGIRNEKRKAEWLGIRQLLNRMTGQYHEIKYSTHGNPYIVNNLHISITHSKQIIGIILSTKEETGIDAEILKPTIVNTAHKFIYENEIDSYEEHDKIKKIYLNWCAKETLYKIKKTGGFDFKEHFQVTTSSISDSGIVKASVLTDHRIETYELSYRFIKNRNDEILIVWH